MSWQLVGWLTTLGYAALAAVPLAVAARPAGAGRRAGRRTASRVVAADSADGGTPACLRRNRGAAVGTAALAVALAAGGTALVTRARTRAGTGRDR